jgi:hypothetical protein
MKSELAIAVIASQSSNPRDHHFQRRIEEGYVAFKSKFECEEGPRLEDGYDVMDAIREIRNEHIHWRPRSLERRGAFTPACMVLLIIVALITWLASALAEPSAAPAPAPAQGHSEENPMDWTAIFTGLLVIVTGGLVFLGWRQNKDARVLQRAYVSVVTGGISTSTNGKLLAHVECKNVGHLPASELKWLLKFTASDDGDWSPPPVDDKDLRPAGVLPIGIGVTTGSHGIGVPQPWTKYLYAWGRVTYVDGFGDSRWTNFCHRYNTDVRETQTGGGSRIRAKDGRHHEHGNDAN